MVQHADIDHTGLTGVGGGGLTQAYVGYDTIGGSQLSMTNDRMYVMKVTLAADCLLSSIDAHLDQGGGNDVVAKAFAALYEDNAGSPRYLLGFSAGVGWADSVFVLDTTSGAGGNSNGRWMRFAIGAWLAAGDYWLGIQGSSRTRLYYDSGSGTGRHFSASGGWATDWGFYSPTTTSDRYSIRGNTVA